MAPVPSTRWTFATSLIGADSLLLNAAETLVRHGHAVRRVITRDDHVERWAEARNIPCSRPDADGLAEVVEADRIDLLFSIGHLEHLSREVIRGARVWAINFHDGPLPAYGGLNAPVWALLNGEREHGITWHVMTDRFDAGDILRQQRFDIAPDETALTLNLKCYQAGIESFAGLLNDLELGHARPVPQPTGERSFYRQKDRPASYALVDPSEPADRIAALVRALDFGTYRNPLATAKLLVDDELYVIGHAEPDQRSSGLPPGTILAAERDAITIATSTDALRLTDLRRLDGTRCEFRPVGTSGGPEVVANPCPADRLAFSGLVSTHAGSEAFWAARLTSCEPTSLPQSTVAHVAGSDSTTTVVVHVPSRFVEGAGIEVRLACAFAVYAARVAEDWTFSAGWVSPGAARVPWSCRSLAAAIVPLRVELDPNSSFADAVDRVSQEFATLTARGIYPSDLPLRLARGATVPVKGARWPLVVCTDRGDQPVGVPPGTDLVCSAGADGRMTLSGRSSAWTTASLKSIASSLTALMHAAVDTPGRSLAELSIVASDEHASLVDEWNCTDSEHPVALVHHAIDRQAEKTPDAVAIVWGRIQLTYADLVRHANRMARKLVDLGVGPNVRVGLLARRSPGAMVAVLATLKAGGAYVPIDPTYPTERIALMLDDARPAVLVSEPTFANRVSWPADRLILLGDRTHEFDADVDRIPDVQASPDDLAYVIYTSGSTGRPKGVMVEHRQVANFFAAMDERLGATRGCWLAVTGFSFDISVLELFWTLARGFTVVIADQDRRVAGARAVRTRRPTDFSLFYFAADAGERSNRKYELLLEGARFADRHGFSAVWTPERHFHLFGGLYPNPAVVGAAIAAVTTRVDIRAGSVVLPLHHPVRVAEEWSVVDNLSGGRVAVSFATGWQPNDFVLRPENFRDNKAALARDLDIVRRLWRGESVTLAGPTGDVAVQIHPRPLQPELRMWITAAGNPSTFEAAGHLGAFVLTHLLGQSIDELAEKVQLYRDARRKAGHAGDGYVTLMLHTFVGSSDDEARQQVRGPLAEYLRTAAGLMKQVASSFPAFRRRVEDGADADKAFASLTPGEVNELVELAVDRYYDTSGLMGSPARCLEMIQRVRSAGVDEVACLIDFGVPSATVLEHLHDLLGLKVADESAHHHDAPDDASDSVATLIRRHHITHVQCTPSQVRLWLSDDEIRSALAEVGVVLIGGEALPVAVAEEIRQLLSGRLLNMYGPTETTVWSTSYEIDGPIGGAVPIGRPLANTTAYVLDPRGQLLPSGVPGELCIGGLGVARGYLGRDDLTRERFVTDPFSRASGARLYRTGDAVRRRPDGVLEFLGRLDHQVKIRGHRVELGEIEAVLGRDDRVREAVVLADGSGRLIGYVAGTAAPTTSGRGDLASDLRQHLIATLPEVMVPAQIVVLDRLPRTPNGKIDRRSLPAISSLRPHGAHPLVPPRSAVERRIAAVYAEVLGVADVSVSDNFFDLGGDSLLAVQVHRRLRETLTEPVALTDVFRFPSIRAMAEHVGRAVSDAGRVRGSQRAAVRRDLARRRHVG